MMRSLIQFLALIVAAVSLTCAAFFYQYEMNRDAVMALCIYLVSFGVAVVLNE